MKSINEIKAIHLRTWDHPNAKFKPGDKARVNALVLGWRDRKCAASKPSFTGAYESVAVQTRIGTEGTIVAVSSPDGRTIRGRSNGWCERQFTRYYIEFAGGRVHPVHSHHLDTVA